MTLEDAIQSLEGRRGNVRFRALLQVCTTFFGEPRIHGSHHLFQMPWPRDPRINLQAEGRDAKPYQLRQVVQALKKLQEMGAE